MHSDRANVGGWTQMKRDERMITILPQLVRTFVNELGFPYGDHVQKACPFLLSPSPLPTAVCSETDDEPQTFLPSICLAACYQVSRWSTERPGMRAWGGSERC